MRRIPNIKMKPLDQESRRTLDLMIRGEAFTGLQDTIDATKAIVSEFLGSKDDLKLVSAAYKLHLLYRRLQNWGAMVDDFNLYEDIDQLLKTLDDAMVLIDVKLGALMLKAFFQRPDDDDLGLNLGDPIPLS